MAATPTTKWQVGGYRFLVRRMEHALVRRDVRMLHDPMRSQSRSLGVGAVLACLVLAGCAALALLRPQDKIGDATIVVGKDSGAMFVAVDGTLHPVLNLASARLIVGNPDSPVTVKESELASKPRGALVGIPGAPSTLPHDLDGEARAWTVCDTTDGAGRPSGTTVLSGDPVYGEHAARLGVDDAFLWNSPEGIFLVYAGRRAQIDLDDRAVVRALGLEGVRPTDVSAGLLNSVPESPPLAPPFIANAGQLPSYPMGGRTIGSVVKVPEPGLRYYVVLADGVQPIGEATALLIKYADSQGSPEIDTIAQDVLRNVPEVSNSIAVQTFPKVKPNIVRTLDTPVQCVSWIPLPVSDGGPKSDLVLSSGRRLPLDEGSTPVRLAQADGSGDAVDDAFLEPGSGGFVQSTDISPSSARWDSLFFVGDTGVRYGVENLEAATALGFGPAAPAPWQIIGLLGHGPVLGRDRALVAHDGVAADPDAAALPAG